MNPIRCLALFAFFALPLAAGAEESQFFVFKKHRDVIELAPDGHFYRNYAGRFSTGTWKRTGDDLAITIDSLWPDSLKLRFDGDALVGEEEHRYVKRETLPDLKFPWPASSPVTLVALDEADGKPITDFSYSYDLETAQAKYWPPVSRRIAVKSATGEFTLDAPESCEIGIRLSSPELVGGHGSYKTLHLKKDTPGRRIEIRVKKGVIVHGIAVEAGSGKPVVGAIVSPEIFTPPLMSPDPEHSELSGPDGQFTIHGADPELGIRAQHPDYEDSGAEIEKTKKEKGVYEVRIEFTAGVKITGTVVDAAGKPVEGVHVEDGAGKEADTGKDGTFVLKSPRKWWDSGKSYYLKFEKDGYNEVTLHPADIDPKGVSVVLEECLSVEGKVFDDAGAPVAGFQVSAGLGTEPESYACSTKEFKPADGSFALTLKGYEEFEKTGKVWIGVSAPGFAPWNAVVDAWKGKKSLEVHLAKGVAIRGTVALPKGHGRVVARIVPSRMTEREWVSSGEPSARQELGTREIELTGGDFAIAGVTAGRYALSVFGERVAPILLALTVPESGLDAGALTVHGTGSVIGKVFRTPQEGGGPWAFADGEIEFAGAGPRSREDNPALQPVRFKTDENGAFRVDGVPAGLVALTVRFRITADMIGGHFRFARVVEGKDTEIRYFEPKGAWELTVKLPIGDGSKDQRASGTGASAERKVENITTRKPWFSFILQPLGDGTGSWPETDFIDPKDTGQVVIPDVSPGKYRLKVVDWLGSRGFWEGVLFDGNIDVGENRTVTVPLGAGSITGQATPHGDIDLMVHVMAVNKKTGEIRHARCDEKGNFCARYLPDGDFVVYAHDHKAGWCRIGELSPKNKTIDVGTVEMAAGGTISGNVDLPPSSTEPLSVRASDAQGFEIQQLERDGAGSGKYTLGSLWPGKWTVKLLEGEKVIGQAVVEVKGTETATCDLKRDAK